MLYFIMLSEDLSPITLFAIVLAYFIAICISMSSHEFAHSYAAYKSGDPTPKVMGRLTLNPLAHLSLFGLLCFFLVGFGWAKPVQVNPLNFKNFKKDMAKVSLAGVITNLIIAFIFSGIFYFVTFLGGIDFLLSENVLVIFIYYLLYFIILLNLVLFLFNLLPIYPLDGYNFLSIFTKYNNPFMQFMMKYSLVILIVLIIPFFDGFSMSILEYIYDFVVYGIWDIFNSFWGLFV